MAVQGPFRKVAVLTTLAMFAFAANSVLCRLALKNADIDPGSFTLLRLLSGSIMLWLLVGFRQGWMAIGGHWASAIALFAYAAGFSFAYVSLPAATGALILFGAVQITMIGFGLWRGERLRGLQTAGFLLACAGLVGLLLPGLTAPPLTGATLMMAAGIAWGVYSLRGKHAGDAMAASAGNFLRTIPFAALLWLWHGLPLAASMTGTGFACAIASGALTSGIGYVLWYAALPMLRATTAATVQLSVPVIAALGGIALLGETLTLRLLLASMAVLGGITLVIRPRRRAP